jgi:hypothetical protein
MVTLEKPALDNRVLSSLAEKHHRSNLKRASSSFANDGDFGFSSRPIFNDSTPLDKHLAIGENIGTCGLKKPTPSAA